MLKPLYAVDRCIRSALLSAFVPSFSVEPTREHVDHRKKVFCELLAAPPLTLALVCLIEKDESGAGSGDDPLDKLDTETGEAVAVGHHNFPD